MLSEPVSLKEDQIQLVTDANGNIRAGNREGHGLYMYDTRYLSAFDLLVEGQSPLYLSHSAERNYIATFQFVNPAMVLSDGTQVNRQTVSIWRSRFIDGQALYERIGFYNCNHFPICIEVTLSFDADFQDMFAVRGYAFQRRGGKSGIEYDTDRLTFSYVGRDGVHRKTIVQFSCEPEPISANAVRFRIPMKPHEPVSITLGIRPTVNGWRSTKLAHFDDALNHLAGSYEHWHRECTDFVTNNEFFDRSLLRQSRLDIRALLEFTHSPANGTNGNGKRTKRLIVPSAGIPWYAVPFGRDSIITALQTLIYNPDIAEGTLRFLALNQGDKVDERTEEEPGKIFHELRRGELANLGEVPHLPYYGTIDATPLFVVLFVEAMKWLTGSSSAEHLYNDLMPNVLRALEWIDRYGDIDGDGYVEYRKGAAGGVLNQGWKDSIDSLQYADGRPATLPVALVEVQGYVFHAKIGLSHLARARGDEALADRLAEEAGVLRERLNRDFWMESEGFYAQGLDSEKTQVPSITSNAGHLLWSGIVPRERSADVVRRLMADDMFSGWGIRTLSTKSPNYNPMSYHNGSVWPHDNSLVALGMRHYGFDREASTVISAVVSAGLRFPSNRLPELFCGFPRDRRFNSSPASYIVSCSPQAWAAASPFLFLQTLLDVDPLSAGKVRVNPIESDLFRRYHLKHMKVGGRRVSFVVHHQADRFLIESETPNVEIVSDIAEVK